VTDETPKLLRIPDKFQSVEDVLAAAAKLDLPNIIVLSEREDGTIVYLSACGDQAGANWLLDRAKMTLLLPSSFERKTRA